MELKRVSTRPIPPGASVSTPDRVFVCRDGGRLDTLLTEPHDETEPPLYRLIVDGRALLEARGGAVSEPPSGGVALYFPECELLADPAGFASISLTDEESPRL